MQQELKDEEKMEERDEEEEASEGSGMRKKVGEKDNESRG